MFAAVVVGSGMFTSIVASQMNKEWVEGVSVMGSSRMLAEQLLGGHGARGPAVGASVAAAVAWTAASLAVAVARLRNVEVVKG